jgi:hypothetical protein
MAVVDALEDRLSFCSNNACQNGVHNHRVIFNFGFFVRGFGIHDGARRPRRRTLQPMLMAARPQRAARFTLSPGLRLFT